MKGLALSGVSLTLGTGSTAVAALRGVSLSVEPGEFVAVVGPSGSGKSSLLAVAGGLRRPDSGSATVGGRPATDHRDQVGYLFQGVNLFASLTVREQVLLPAHLRGRIRAADRTRADDLLAAVGLVDRFDRRPHQLSGGERQRVGLARALMAHPVALLVDEPTSALDRARAAEIVALLAERTRAEGAATVMVTHDQEILGMADRVHEMRDGRLD